MANVITKTDIRQLWNQIVETEGRSKYTAEEWQESFDDFCRCILYDPKPIIRIDALDQLEKGILNSQVVLPNQGQSLIRDDTPRPRQGVNSADRVTEMWMQRDASLKRTGRVSRPNQDNVPVSPNQNNPPIPEPQQLSHNQWTRPNTLDVPMTSLENRDFRIPRAPFQAQAPNQRFNSENPFNKSQPSVSNVKQPENQLSLQEIFEQSRLRRSVPVPNANADPSRLHSMANQEGDSQAKKPKMEISGQMSLQEIYEQSRMRRSVPVPNANMDPSKFKNVMNPEMDSQAKKQKLEINGKMSLQEIYEQSRMRRSIPVPNANADPSKNKMEIGKASDKKLADISLSKETNQEVKLPIVDDKKVNPIDDWLKNFTDESSNCIDQDISVSSDFFNNLPNPSLVIGKTSMELKAVLNNMQTDPKISKKAKKRSKKSK